MTAIVEPNDAAEMCAGTLVWRCDLCRCFHLRAGEMLLTRTREEFSAFTREVVDCCCGELHTRRCQRAVAKLTAANNC